MASTTSSPSCIHKYAKEYLIAKSAFLKAYRQHWNHEVSECSDESGWKMLSAFRGEVEKYSLKLGRPSNGIARASREFFRFESVGQADYSFDEATGFVKWYITLTNKIVTALGHLFDAHQDSFYELADAYPLAGQELVELAIASDYRNRRSFGRKFLFADEVSSAILEKSGTQWHILICETENNIARSLRHACRNYFLLRVFTGHGEHIAWEDGERTSLTFSRLDWE